MIDERGTVKTHGTRHDRRYWKQTGVIPRWQLLLIYAAIVAAAAAGMLRTETIARSANRAAGEAQRAIEGVQRSRIDVCKDANSRHDAALAELDLQIRHLPPAERARARARRAGTVAFIETLAPRHDCEKELQPAMP